MCADTDIRHKPGIWKQQNKGHKHGKHRSKGELEREARGRVGVKVLSKRRRQELGRMERRNQAKQIRERKREEVLNKKRNRGSQGVPPHLVIVLALSDGLDIGHISDLLIKCDETATVSPNEQGVIHISLPRFKQCLSLYVPKAKNLTALLDAAKIADSILAVISPDIGIDDYGDHCLTCLFAQGIPAVTFVSQGFKDIAQKKQGDVRKFLQSQIEDRFPGSKFHSLDTSQDALLILRQVTNQKLRNIQYKEHRPHLLADEISFELDNDESTHGTLKVTGYLRGVPLTVNRLIHLPGWGDFQMSQIDAPPDPYPLFVNNSQRKKGLINMSEGSNNANNKMLERADPSCQVSLQSEVIPDHMEAEQTWPTEEELKQAKVDFEAKEKHVKRVPKGTSEYQAAWIIPSDDEDEQSDDSEDEDDMYVDAEDAVSSQASDGEEGEGEDHDEYETITVTDDAAKYDDLMDLDEDRLMLAKTKEEHEHAIFPDEVDTPMEMAARVRFQRYRGLQSFRTSPWDPKENLPPDYARIFQFKNFRQTKKKVLAEDQDEGAWPGWYITVHVENVPKEFMVSYKPGTPVILFGLLPHEQKLSVINYVIRRVKGDTRTIKSKDRLIFHVGYRRFTACPVFSQHTNSDKHKFERFLPQDGVSVATVFAPVMFPPAPVMVFQQTPDGCHELVATGSLLSVDPDRRVIKRIILSGHPLKILKKTAVIRYMFFNRDDIQWFKPVELRTKWGRRGHIREPLGTHGHMKCQFDGQLKSQDTVLLNLFKRVYPKWTYNPHVPNPEITGHEGSSGAMDTEQAYKLFD